VVDATPQSPPLEVDDPGVPDDGEYELNLTTKSDLSFETRSVDLLHVDLNYGIEPTIFGYHLRAQLKFECPFASRHEPGSPVALGFGAATVGIKLNVYSDEHLGTSIAFYPQLEFPMAGSVKKRLADPGQTLGLPILVLKEFKDVTFVANAGLEAPFHDSERRTKMALAGGLGRALTRKLAVMGDLRSEIPFDRKADRLAAVDAGVIYGVRHIPVYAEIGRTLVPGEGPHTIIAFGMKMTSAGRGQ